MTEKPCDDPTPLFRDMRTCANCGQGLAFRDRIIHVTPEEAAAERERYAEGVQSLKERVQEAARKHRVMDYRARQAAEERPKTRS